MRPLRPRCPTCQQVTPLPPLQRLIVRLLRMLPEDTHARVVATFAMSERVYPDQKPEAHLLMAIDSHARDMADQGHPVEVAST